MANNYFQFKQFTIHQDRCAMKVTTDACLFGAWVADEINRSIGPSQLVLDIGTGTGLLSLMIVQKNPELSVDAIEIDPGAVKQAKENSNLSPWRNHLNIVEGDIKKISTDKSYDILVSNPPFYENELTSPHANKNLAHHSSELGFDDLLRAINMHLRQSGIFYLLLPYKRKEEIKKATEAYGFFVSKEVYVRQSVHHDYFRIMIEGKKEKVAQIEKSEISIRNEKQEYSNEFIKYLQAYYLYL